MFNIDEYCVVNKGIVPNNNEDNIFVNGFKLDKNNDGINNYTKRSIEVTKNMYYGIFDGISGLDKGEYASYLATTIVSKYQHLPVKELLKKINTTILKINKDDDINMGTTASILKFNKNKCELGIVGDSSIFILSNDKLVKYPTLNNASNLIDNYLGKDEYLKIESFSLNLKNNDKILICSDGLTKLVDELEIEYILSSSKDVNYISNKLMNEALLHGGNDNISIITLLVRKDYKQYIYLGLSILIILFIIIILCI